MTVRILDDIKRPEGQIIELSWPGDQVPWVRIETENLSDTKHVLATWETQLRKARENI